MTLTELLAKYPEDPLVQDLVRRIRSHMERTLCKHCGSSKCSCQ